MLSSKGESGPINLSFTLAPFTLSNWMAGNPFRILVERRAVVPKQFASHQCCCPTDRSRHLAAWHSPCCWCLHLPLTIIRCCRCCLPRPDQFGNNTGRKRETRLRVPFARFKCNQISRFLLYALKRRIRKNLPSKMWQGLGVFRPLPAVSRCKAFALNWQ